MDEVFFKSALPPRDSLVLGDSSLALPAEPSPLSSGKPSSKDRSLRVQQQVQLTMSRKTRKPGSVQSQKSTVKSSEATHGPANMKVNGAGLTNRSLSHQFAWRPSRRVDLSPNTSPQLTPRHFSHSTFRHGTFTHPGPTQTHRFDSPLQRSFGSDSFRRYAFSEAPRASRPQASTATFESFKRRSLRGQPAFSSPAFQQSGQYGSRSSTSRTVLKQEARNAQVLNGDVTFGSQMPDEGLSWLARIKRQAEGTKVKSYPASVASDEVDVGQRVQAELPIKTQNVTALQTPNKPPEMSLERAVNLLSHDDEETLVCAASHIQNQCFRSTDAKRMIYYLRGINKLLKLLHHDSEEVQQVAAGALRNVVYQSNENKIEVKESDGLAAILKALKSSRNVETRRELTGLLWNLSSHDLLKERLSREAVSVLTKSVLVPSSGLSEGENPKDDLLADDEAFHNATGCLRNLSSAGPDGRKAMRECENLIDAVVYYIRGAISDYKTDDKSTENCVCILHNLSYQIEAELPEMCTRDLRDSPLGSAPKAKAVGCFAYRSAKITENLERQCPLLEEKANPRGIEWLWSSITVRMYLSLMARSVRQHTQEAALGALQNITAGNGSMVEAIAFTIVQRENGLQQVKRMLEEGESDVKRSAVSLIRNLSRYKELHPAIAKQVMPEVVGMLPNDDTGSDLPTEVTVSLCHILINLSQSDKQHVRAIVNERALPKIINISSKDSGYGPSRAGQAACLLLHTMWKHADLHSAYRRCGYRKDDFINARTTKAVNSG